VTGPSNTERIDRNAAAVEKLGINIATLSERLESVRTELLHIVRRVDDIRGDLTQTTPHVHTLREALARIEERFKNLESRLENSERHRWQFYALLVAFILNLLASLTLLVLEKPWQSQ
jgi:chromosome segregation ATPase